MRQQTRRAPSGEFAAAGGGVSLLPRAKVRIAIVGAGFSGLGTAIRLKQAGIEDFLVLEREPVRAAVYADFESRAVAMTVDTRLLKGYQAVARWHMHRQVRDPGLRAKLQPSYLIGCKRILVSNDYHPAPRAGRAGVPRHRGESIPEFLHPAGTGNRSRTQLGHLHDRVANWLRTGVPGHDEHPPDFHSRGAP